MTLEQASRWRNLVGKAGALLCAFVFLAVLDGLIARFREPPGVIKVLPGSSVEINGPATAEVRDVRDLSYESSSQHLHLSFAAVHKGYFLGGDMWRGHLKVSPLIQPGEYHLSVRPRGQTPPPPLPPFRILVYPDSISLQQSYTSFIQRYVGHSPWLVALGLLPLALLAFGAVFFLSQKMADLLAQSGRAEVYRVLRRDEGFEIHVGLGTKHGVHPGALLAITDETGQMLGTVAVEEASWDSSWATLKTEQEIRPGYLATLLKT